ncbi:MAG TPA: hypothetical protein VGR70_16550, partial [Stellaceae bacterium]|nr:hypothetical protein [Stellaceae bacterium]
TSVDDILFASVVPGTKEHRDDMWWAFYDSDGTKDNRLEIFQRQLKIRGVSVPDDEIERLYDWCRDHLYDSPYGNQ